MKRTSSACAPNRLLVSRTHSHWQSGKQQQRCRCRCLHRDTNTRSEHVNEPHHRQDAREHALFLRWERESTHLWQNKSKNFFVIKTRARIFFGRYRNKHTAGLVEPDGEGGVVAGERLVLRAPLVGVPAVERDGPEPRARVVPRGRLRAGAGEGRHRHGRRQQQCRHDGGGAAPRHAAAAKRRRRRRRSHW